MEREKTTATNIIYLIIEKLKGKETDNQLSPFVT
jgi:hypothetical protein